MAIHEREDLRDRTFVFRDREHAGSVLAALLEGLRGSDASVLAIPAGGVPVAAALARALELELGVAVVSKVTLPWNTEVGCGAVGFDGSLLLNEALIADLGLDPEEVERRVAATRKKVASRVAAMGGAMAVRAFAQTCVLVDDGLASGYTMRVAVAAVREAGAARVIVAVPTGSLRTVCELSGEVEELYCANVRGGGRFAVAEAYESWSDVEEAEALAILERSRSAARCAAAQARE